MFQATFFLHEVKVLRAEFRGKPSNIVQLLSRADALLTISQFLDRSAKQKAIVFNPKTQNPELLSQTRCCFVAYFNNMRFARTGECF
jgi:hypothetical protein